MGTAEAQGEPWGARARNWSNLQKRFIRPAYEVVFDEINVGSNTKLLEVGCGAGGPFALSEPGRIESAMERAGLTVVGSGEVDCPFEYPDAETAWRAIGSAGPLIGAIPTTGEERVRETVLDSLTLQDQRKLSTGEQVPLRHRYCLAIGRGLSTILQGEEDVTFGWHNLRGKARSTYCQL